MIAPGEASHNDVILATEHLSRVVGGVTLVNDVSVEIHTRELVAVVGPSGSGKSSFLRLLNRLDEPTSGTVTFEGLDYRLIPPRELRRKIGMVTQRAYLFPGSVADNISFGPRQRGEEMPPDEIDGLLVHVGLPGFSDRNVANLSGGEAQRVSLARALANSPTVLLLDEPTSALDQEAKIGIESLIEKIVQQSQLTCVLVTHDFEQASRVADRVMVFQAGRVLRVGSATEVLHA
ncbi:MAG: transporter, ATPase subunit [Candidatus Angelobacter sp.]|jgi:putative ABC transport system ATP-binding protein|nr:transporter, ATPase subunit [Candidatus Angelobacter sp.]